MKSVSRTSGVKVVYYLYNYFLYMNFYCFFIKMLIYVFKSKRWEVSPETPTVRKVTVYMTTYTKENPTIHHIF